MTQAKDAMSQVVQNSVLASSIIKGWKGATVKETHQLMLQFVYHSASDQANFRIGTVDGKERAFDLPGSSKFKMNVEGVETFGKLMAFDLTGLSKFKMNVEGVETFGKLMAF